ncbi:MAG: hypothetical protein CL916_02475 [Deltaproteobacteria bacterium]|nr:hypothetical protein [Deltaproteobacteria bacterium]
MRISLLVHGFPPHESAGTEQHTAMLCSALTNRGHTVQIINATRSPGHPHGTIVSNKNHHRIVNNVSARPLHTCEKDLIIRHHIERLWSVFDPDIIHVQHIQFLSSDLTFPCPAIMTLHDAWLWCAAGGQEIDQKMKPCPGPDPQKCASCAPSWSPKLPKRGQFLMRIAQALHKIIPASKLNQMWHTLPLSLRFSFSHSTQKFEPESPIAAKNRNIAMIELSKKFASIIAPSQYLANRAQEHQVSPVRVLRHGVQNHKRHIGGDGFLFVGTIAKHKGPHLVYQAHKKSKESHRSLRFYGSLQTPQLIPEDMWKGIIANHEICDLFQRADALIMGSIWPENAPLVIIEAHSVGCPVIAPRIGGIPELIEEGTNGLLYEPGNIEELAACMSQIVHIPKFDMRPPLFNSVVEAHLAMYEEHLCTHP